MKKLQTFDHAISANEVRELYQREVAVGKPLTVPGRFDEYRFDGTSDFVELNKIGVVSMSDEELREAAWRLLAEHGDFYWTGRALTDAKAVVEDWLRLKPDAVATEVSHS